MESSSDGDEKEITSDLSDDRYMISDSAKRAGIAEGKS